MTIVVDPDYAPASGLTLNDLIARVRRELVDKDNLNTLAEDLDVEDTTIKFEHSLEGITRGTLLNVDDETLYVWSSDVANKSCLVERGYNSEVQQHGVGTLVTAGGRSNRQITDAINDELMSLNASGLYQMRSVAIAGYNPYQLSWPVPELATSNFYEAQYQPLGQPNTWLRLSGARFSSLDSTVCVDSWPPSSLLRVLYRAPFTRLLDGGDDVQNGSGLQSEAADVLVYGAAYRLTASEEYKRNDFRTQGDTRRPDEVPYRALSLARRDYKELRDNRLSEERDRLRRRFPLIKNGY